MHGHAPDEGKTAEGTDEPPEYGKYIPHILQLLMMMMRPVAHEAGDWVWDVLPWRCGYPWIQVSVDIERPFSRIHGCGQHCDIYVSLNAVYLRPDMISF